MATLPTSLGAITLFVDDVPRAKGFYQGAFDLEPIHEDDDSAAFKFENTIVNLLSRPAAHELVEPATVAASGAGSSFQLTIWVEDTDALIEELRKAKEEKRDEEGHRDGEDDRAEVRDLAHGSIRTALGNAFDVSGKH